MLIDLIIVVFLKIINILKGSEMALRTNKWPLPIITIPYMYSRFVSIPVPSSAILLVSVIDQL